MFWIIGWIVFGLFVGLIARGVVPGPQAMGCFRTIVLGIGGSFVGGLIGYQLRGGDLIQSSGWIGSIVHPASNMVGPGIARDQASASALLWHELNHRRGQTMVSLLPVTATDLVAAAYQWGAKNCELHFSQVRGKYQVPNGIVLPTFMPETS